MNDSLWKLDNISLSGAERPRLRESSLQISPGLTAIVGQSGAGKTSLLNLLVGFETPDAGTLTANLPGVGNRLPLFWVPQNLGLWPHLSVAENLQAVLPTDGKTDGAIEQLLDEFDLTELAAARPDRLSQGERSRLSVARAIASGASVLVMDEPLVHVNPSRVNSYWDVLRRHIREADTSLVFATHSPETILREAKQAICLSAGRVLFDGPVEQLYWHPADPELADFLGAHNWLTSEESQHWLNHVEAEDRCFRPEQITVIPEQKSPLVVESSRFAGSLAEVELRDERSGQSRRFFHRPSGNGMAAGTRVTLKVLALLLFCLLSAGCGSEASETTGHFRHWPTPADGASIPAPRAMHVSDADGELYVLDDAGRVLVFDLDMNPRRQWRMPESSVGNPEGLCLMSDGRLVVADTHYHRLVFFDKKGKLLGMQGSRGEEPGQFIYPVAVVTDDAGNLYVGEYGGNDRVQKFSPEGEFLLAFGGFGTEPGEFQRPSGLVWWDHKIYVADAFNNRLQLFSDNGDFLGILGKNQSSSGLHYPYDITQGSTGDLFVVEYGAGRVSRLDLEGNLLSRFGTSGVGEGEFKTPWGLAVSGDSRVFVADTGNRRIVERKL
jgi:ABC-type glutathione transport system ATPase component/DNA-binding beta-propeller fold protein YncE